MSLYRTLYTDLPCGHCGQVRTVGVQFRTGDDRLEEYGDKEYWDNNSQNPPAEAPQPCGGPWPGTADNYCQICLQKRRADEVMALYESLAELVHCGRLEIRKGFWQGFVFRSELAPNQLLAMGQRYSERARKLPSEGWSLFDGLADCVLNWNRRPARQGTANYSDFLEAVNARIAEAMKKQGWHRRSLLREDIMVFMDDDGCMRAKLPEAVIANSKT